MRFEPDLAPDRARLVRLLDALPTLAAAEAAGQWADTLVAPQAPPPALPSAKALVTDPVWQLATAVRLMVNACRYGLRTG